MGEMAEKKAPQERPHQMVQKQALKSDTAQSSRDHVEREKVRLYIVIVKHPPNSTFVYRERRVRLVPYDALILKPRPRCRAQLRHQ